MRDKNLSFIQFCSNVEDFVVGKFQSISILREPVIVNPTLLSEDYFIVPRSYKLNELRGLAIISYYLPEFLEWKIRLFLQECVIRFCHKDRLKLALLLINEQICLTFLYETLEFSSSEFFGSLLDNGFLALKGLQIRRKRFKVVIPARRRGYNDMGSKRSMEKWLPTFDWSLTELQNELERRLDFNIKVQSKLEKFLLQKYFSLLQNEDFEKDKD